MILDRWKYLVIASIFLGVPAAGNDEVDHNAELGRYLASHGYGVLKVEVGDRNNQIIQAKINGRSVSLLVDTGFTLTSLSASCARRLGLQVRDNGLTTFGVGGEVQGHNGLASVSSFTLNNYEINRLSVINVLPKHGVTEGVDGYFGFDYLHANAMLLPVGARILMFRPGAGAAPPIDHYMALLGFTAIPLTYEKGGLRVHGHLNGHPLNALIDCGASLTTFDINYVTGTAKTIASYIPDFKFSGVDGHRIDAFTFTPKSLDLGPLTLPPTELMASTMPLGAKEGFDVLIGYDILASHEAIIDLGHDTLWMK